MYVHISFCLFIRVHIGLITWARWNSSVLYMLTENSNFRLQFQSNSVILRERSHRVLGKLKYNTNMFTSIWSLQMKPLRLWPGGMYMGKHKTDITVLSPNMCRKITLAILFLDDAWHLARKAVHDVKQFKNKEMYRNIETTILVGFGPSCYHMARGVESKFIWGC